MSVFTESELEFLRSVEFPGGAGARRLGRIATVGKGGTPRVVPVAFSYNPSRLDRQVATRWREARSTATSSGAAGLR